MEVDVSRIFQATLASAGILTECQAFSMLDEAVLINNASDIASYTKACDTIITHLIKQVGVIVQKLRTQPLTNQEMELIKTIFNNCSAARSYIIQANKSNEIIHAEDAMANAVQLLTKSNFRGLP